MTQQVEKKCVEVEYCEAEEELLDRHVKREIAQAKAEEFLLKLNFPRLNGAKRLINKAKLNVKYFEDVIPIQRVKSQQNYRDYGIR